MRCLLLFLLLSSSAYAQKIRGSSTGGGSSGLSEPLTLTQTLTFPDATAQETAAGHFGQARPWGACASPTSTAGFLGINVATGTCGSTGGTIASGTDSTRRWVNHTTGAAANNASGNSVTGVLRWADSPRFYATIKTGSNITAVRYSVGLNASANPASASLNDTNPGCAFRFATNVPDTNWMACSSGSAGVTPTCTSTGVAVTANTVYTMHVDGRTSGACKFYINGALVVNKTTAPIHAKDNINVRAAISLETLEAVAKNMLISHYAWDWAH